MESHCTAVSIEDKNTRIYDPGYAQPPEIFAQDQQEASPNLETFLNLERIYEMKNILHSWRSHKKIEFKLVEAVLMEMTIRTWLAARFVERP